MSKKLEMDRLLSFLFVCFRLLFRDTITSITSCMQRGAITIFILLQTISKSTPQVLNSSLIYCYFHARGFVHLLNEFRAAPVISMGQ